MILTQIVHVNFIFPQVHQFYGSSFLHFAGSPNFFIVIANNMQSTFDWDEERNTANKFKHGVDFETAKYAFLDPYRLIVHDAKHSESEERWFCISKVNGQVLTVRFTYRGGVIRIFGAAEWRKWRKFYEQQNS